MEGWFRRSLLHLEIQPAWALIAGVVLVAICFGNSIPNDFVLDDYGIVAVNPAIRTIAPVHALLTRYWGEKSNAGIYRPLTIVSFSLEYPLWHRWPGGYRLTNLLLHAINGVWVFLLARGLLQSAAGAYAASAIYLVHPVHTEPVIGLVGRSELLAAMFFFTAWLLFRQRRTALSACAFFLSMLSKESAIAFPAVMFLDVWIVEGHLRRVLPHWRRFVPIIGCAFAYFGLRLWVLGSLGIPRSAQYLEGQWTLLQREFTSGRAFLKYFELLFAPFNIAGDYDFNSIPLTDAKDAVAWLGLLIIGATIVLAFRLLRTHRAVSFGILFFYLTILPVSNWIIPTSLIMAERFLYLPSFGLSLIGGFVWTKLPSPELRRMVGAGVMAIAAVLCIANTYVWRDNLTFFRNVVRLFPNNIRGRQGYGVALLEELRVPEAREQFEAGLQVKRITPLLVGLAEADIQTDHGCVNARPVLNEALTIQPDDPFARWLLASCFEKEGLLEQAESTYRRAVADTPFPDPKLLDDWARVLERTGRPAEAQEAHRRAAPLK